MRLDFNLQLQQEQKLIMTQEMQMAVKMLQLSSLELVEYIEEQLIENPVLELDEESFEHRQNDLVESFIDYIDEYEDRYDSETVDTEEINRRVSPLNFIVRERSLWEHLKEQLGLIPLSREDRRIGIYIIDNIDENGYLAVSLEEVSSKLSVGLEEVQDVIELIQNFDPIGVCARNFRECLELQLKHKGIYDEVFENIVSNMLERVGYGDISSIARDNGISVDEALWYIDRIKKLDPKPGIRFSAEVTRYIIPDVYIEKVEGEYTVRVNDDYIPQLKINRTYRKVLRNKETPEYKYVRDKIQAAMWLIKSINQRISTIKNVVTSILDYQINFFERDYDLKPLTLKQIAQDIGMHESTVSRAVKGKYVQTPKGLFEIKNFFIKGIQNKSGEDISVVKIKNRIREVINSEDRRKPFSDQTITEKLIDEGMDISRRTVAKYREEMNIASSSKRKQR